MVRPSSSLSLSPSRHFCPSRSHIRIPSAGQIDTSTASSGVTACSHQESRRQTPTSNALAPRRPDRRVCRDHLLGCWCTHGDTRPSSATFQHSSPHARIATFRRTSQRITDTPGLSLHTLGALILTWFFDKRVLETFWRPAPRPASTLVAWFCGIAQHGLLRRFYLCDAEERRAPCDSLASAFGRPSILVLNQNDTLKTALRGTLLNGERAAPGRPPPHPRQGDPPAAAHIETDRDLPPEAAKSPHTHPVLCPAP